MLDSFKTNGSFVDSLKKGASEMKFWQEGASKKVAFGRIAGVGVGAGFIAHSFKGKNSQGEDRSGVVRVGEAALGAAVMGGSLAFSRA